MKILILSDDFPPQSSGGAGRIVFNLACGLKKKGHQVFVITTIRKHFNEENINYKGLKIFKIYSKYHERWRAYLSLYNPQTVKKVERIIRQVGPDIVHAHNIHYHLSYHCLKSARKYSKKVFLTAHDAMLVYYGKWASRNLKDCKITILDQIKEAQKRYNPFRNIFIKYFLNNVDNVFTVSNSLKQLLEANNIERVRTIHNGIDAKNWEINSEIVEEFKKKHGLFGKKVILFGGRLSRLKGGGQAIRTIVKIKEQIPSIVLLVAGQTKGYAQEMQILSQRLGIENHIIFTGWLESDELKTAYNSSHVVIVPSIYTDPFPTVSLEAMACKKPVIGTCFGGTKEIVQDGVTGYVVNPLDVDIMAEKIIDLLKNPQKAEQFGQAGYKRVKTHFSLEQHIENTIYWY